MIYMKKKTLLKIMKHFDIDFSIRLKLKITKHSKLK